LKVDEPERVLHKSEEGAVVLGIEDEEGLEKAFESLSSKFNGAGMLLQRMVEVEREAIVGAAAQPGGIHLLMFGAGGVAVELLRDVSFSVAPVTPSEAERMMKKIKLYPLFAGYRNYAKADTSVLAECIERVSALVTDFPQIKELDINPLKVPDAPDRPVAVDVRMLVE